MMNPEELLQLKALLIDDAVTAIKEQNTTHQRAIDALITPAIQKVDTFEARIKTLEKQKLLVIKGALVYASVVSVLIGAFGRWIAGKFSIKL